MYQNIMLVYIEMGLLVNRKNDFLIGLSLVIQY